MNEALVAINPDNRTAEIVSVWPGTDDTWEEIRERRLVAVPTTLDKARLVFGQQISDIYELTSGSES